MNDHDDQLKTYVQQQLHAGFTPDEVAAHLRAANWQETDIQNAFQALKNDIMPGAAPEHAGHMGHSQPQPTTVKKGRIRTGWRLLKQSLAILRGNKGLARYAVMSAVWSFVIMLVMLALAGLIILVTHPASADDIKLPVPIFYLLVIGIYGIFFFIANFYAAGLTANVMDIFQGQKKSYREYMAVARSKAGALMVYSLIEATVGLLLRLLAERVRLVGWIIARILGALWSLGTMFVVPIIVTGGQPNAVNAIKQSMGFFKKTWGEGITAKVTAGTAVFIINLLLTIGTIVIGFGLLILAGTLFGDVGAAITGILIATVWIVAVVVLSILSVLANSIINVALFYYATYGQVPPAFDADLLNSVFIARKPK